MCTEFSGVTLTVVNSEISFNDSFRLEFSEEYVQSMHFISCEKFGGNMVHLKSVSKSLYLWLIVISTAAQELITKR